MEGSSLCLEVFPLERSAIFVTVSEVEQETLSRVHTRRVAKGLRIVEWREKGGIVIVIQPQIVRGGGVPRRHNGSQLDEAM